MTVILSEEDCWCWKKKEARYIAVGVSLNTVYIQELLHAYFIAQRVKKVFVVQQMTKYSLLKRKIHLLSSAIFSVPSRGFIIPGMSSPKDMWSIR